VVQWHPQKDCNVRGEASNNVLFLSQALTQENALDLALEKCWRRHRFVPNVRIKSRTLWRTRVIDVAFDDETLDQHLVAAICAAVKLVVAGRSMFEYLSVCLPRAFGRVNAMKLLHMFRISCKLNRRT